MGAAGLDLFLLRYNAAHATSVRAYCKIQMHIILFFLIEDILTC